MSELDDKLAALHAEAQAKANALVAQAKAEEAAKDVSGSELAPDEVAGKIAEVKTSLGTSAAHPAVSHLFDLVKHLLSVHHASDAKTDALYTSDSPAHPDSY